MPRQLNVKTTAEAVTTVEKKREGGVRVNGKDLLKNEKQIDS